MHKLPPVFLTLSIVAAITGFSGVGGPMVNGLGKALGAVFFILYFIARTAGQASDEPAAEQTQPAHARQTERRDPPGETQSLVGRTANATQR